jgi:hypothetical protein
MSSVLALIRGNVGIKPNVMFNQNFNPPFGIPAMANGAAFPTAIDRGYSPPGAITTFDDFTNAGVNSRSFVDHVKPNIPSLTARFPTTMRSSPTQQRFRGPQPRSEISSKPVGQPTVHLASTSMRPTFKPWTSGSLARTTRR